MSYRVVNPEQMGVPSGWNNGMLAPAGGRVLFVAGQTARAEDGRVPEIGFVEQFGQALDAILSVVGEAGGSARDIGRLTIFVTDIDAYRTNRKELGAAYRERMGKHFPAMALLQVRGLVDPNAMVEIEATAVIPPAPNLQDSDGRALLV